MRKALLLFMFLLAPDAYSELSTSPRACYLYDASGNPLSSTAGALNIAGGVGGGGNAAAGLTGIAVPTSAGYTGYNSGGNLVGVSTANPLPVSQQGSVALAAGSAVIGHVIVDTAPSTAVTGPLTDTQLRASAVPITVDGAKTTAATMPAGGSGAIGWLSAIFNQLLQTLTVSISNATLAVTQSGTWTVQPGNTANTTPWLMNVSQFGGTNLSTGTGAGGVGIPRVTVSNDSNVIVTPPTLTKATQGATGFSTQDLKDAGRSARTITLDGFAIAATTETLHTMSYSTDNGTLTTGTSYAVTAAKRLRIQQISVSLHTIAGNTTPATVIVRIRVNNGGAALVSSPVQMVFAIPGVTAANNSTAPIVIPIPDGWEFVAGAGIGVTSICPGFVATTAAPKLNISITGYEY